MSKLTSSKNKAQKNNHNTNHDKNALTLAQSRQLVKSRVFPPDDLPYKKDWLPGIFGVLDIGSNKITCLIGQGKSNGQLQVLGYGWRRSHGVKQGGIVNLQAAERAIRSAVGQAEEAAERRLSKIYVNLSGGKPQSQLFNVDWPIGGKEINNHDIYRLVNEGVLRAQIDGREIIHALPLAFNVDETSGVEDPRGHQCELLSTRLHIIDTSATALRNLATVLMRAELEIEAIISTPLAAGLAVMAPDERELGATIVDMGGGTTSIGIFGEGQLLYTSQIPIGGSHITRDIAGILSTSIDTAEWLKTMWGSAEYSYDDEYQQLPIQMIGDDDYEVVTKIPLSRVISIIRPRIEETLELIRDRLDNANVGNAANGRVILTGGGSLLDGLGPLAARILNRQIRLGKPNNIIGLPDDTANSAAFSTAAGLLAWAAGDGRTLADLDFAEKKSEGFLKKLIEFIRIHI
ncbi:Cell division ATPase FtsA (FtsA) (PDB:3WT0) [Commensalibacter communis]|uniref:Cell division protein FtsA n=1 Tax=Commensalibacter communis TaxID=2972786 RepID=A0A9W4TMH2_9PROT|nr:cell division protein FtsA [Commensalibacter communis]CAI3922229.1 Cell division ATPase FtsA (FtsA) (PDB:3WT0) [Commensalibacter communis]CAI3923220.1 Cell division ATPase FtsA (FtsA) (PDB:3WT0) [Commensalibacter communis]CAI3923277.1 Cell division ATPase FtsA (FtsA) (PDB:3WT0) [Commensalibacter communis]CAI3923451.1 Cell division ATPase FtsA (FtsA) (PDB:3WT0) [Commensalibacter communis]CAI3924192.1 Cell division ATPase FtsA (FtsA) (PDB:3WT0) [Commensalibacter communis]